jgi:toxin ParE1/3/4
LKLIWNPQAYDDRAAIMDYIAQDSPAAALDIDEAIEHQADSLIQHPEIGRHGRVRGTRELVIARTPYVAVYVVDGEAETIEIIRVLHGAQQWPSANDED